MVAIQHHLAARDVGNRVKTGVLLYFHADLEAVAVAFGGLEADKVRVVVPERVLGLELDLQRLAGALALQRALERREELAIAAVQVTQFGRCLKLDTLRVVQMDPQAYDGVLAYERRRLTTSNTSAAWPRGLIP
jgi:hypothetical protein